MPHHTLLYIRILVLLGTLAPLGVKGQQIVSLSDPAEVYALDRYTSIWVDSTQKLSFEQILSPETQVKFSPFQKKTLSLGYVKSPVWIKLNLKNKAQTSQWYLEIPIAILDTVVFYQSAGEKWQKTVCGYYLPHRERGILHTGFVFPLRFDGTAPTTIYIKIAGNSPKVMPLRVWEKERFHEKTRLEDVGYGILFGVLLIMFLYNLMIYLTLHDISYLLYICTIVCTISLIGTTSGYAGKYIWADYPIMNFYGARLMLGFLTIFVSAFAINFLDTRRYAKTIHYILLVTIPVTVGAIICVFTGVMPSATNTLVPFTSPMFLIAGIVCWIRGNVTARFYTLAWAVYIIGGTSATLRNTGVLNYNFWSTHLFEIGAASETFLLAFALSDRYRRFKKEKEEAIQDLLRAEKEANETLEQKVKERTQEIQAALHTIQEQNDELTVLNEETRQQSEEITAQRDALAGANQEIRKQNQDIIASITYARRIQTALLPSKERIKAYLPDLLLFYQPKDIVSGDFYWFAEGKDTVFLAVADCTGHGVPGALMTVIGESLLDHIINIDKIHSPAKILTELDKRLLKTLRQQGIEAEKVQDGMDIALLRIDTKNKQILWAGAMRPIWIFNPDYPEPTIHKGNKFPIGSNQFKQKSYAEQSISLQMGDTIYAFTDGYADQFGVQGKFNIKQFRTWLTAHFQKPFEEQHQLLHDTFHAWKGIERQTDDVLVLGFRV